MEQKTSFWKSALIYGLYIGIAQIIFSVILYAAGLSLNKTLGYLSILIIIGGIIWAQLNYRKMNDGLMAYGTGVGLAVASMLVSGVISAIFTYLLYKVIDPGLYEQVMIMTQEATTQKLVQRGMSDDQINQVLEMSKKFQSAGIISIGVLINSVVIGAVIGLITSIFIKKKPAEEVTE